MTKIIISGPSGSGKTTLGQILAKKFMCDFVDLDSFYLPDKPQVKLSNGKLKKNWDCLEALDIKKMQEVITAKKNVVFVGFCLTKSIVPIKPDIHIHLSLSDNPSEIIDRCIEARKKSKNFSEEQSKEDELMIREVTFPFYQKSKKESEIDIEVQVFENGQRKSILQLIQELTEHIDKKIIK